MKTIVHIASLLVLNLSAPALAQPTEQAPPSAEVECEEYATPEERSDPERLVVRGVACFERGEYVTALRHYREAGRLSDSNLLNAAIGRVFQELGHPHIARRYYKNYLSGRSDDAENRARIEQRLADVEQELAADGADVEITSSPPEATVYLVIADAHREDVGRTPLTLRMAPGRHRFVVEADGYVTREEAVTVASSEAPYAVDARLVRTDSVVGVPGRTLRRAGTITMAASVPFIAGGAALFVAGSMKKGGADEMAEPRRSELLDSGGKEQRAGAVVGIVGITALATGAAMYLFGLDRSPLDDASGGGDTSTAFHPVVGLGHVGAIVHF